MRFHHSSHGRLPFPAKLACVIACSKGYTNGEVDYGFAVNALKSMEKGKWYDYIGGHKTETLKRVWRNLTVLETLGDAPRSGRPPLFTKEDALQAAALLKKGKMGSFIRGGRRWNRLVYYTTVEQACHEDPALEAIRVKYNATYDQLRHAMKQHDPDLSRRTLTYHPDFSAQQLADRMSQAASLLAQCPTNPTALRAHLDRFMWGDEGSISLSSENLEHVRVWCSKANYDVNDIISLPKVRGQKDCKVHFFIVVSSHPAFRDSKGVVYFEWTTGTDDIRRLQNTMGQTVYEPYGYMVSGVLLHITVLQYGSM